MAAKKPSALMLDISGLRADQIRKLTRMRDAMRGWKFIGCIVDIDGDYWWTRGTITRELEKAERFKDAAAAQHEIDTKIRDGADDERVFTIQGLYQNGDEFDTGPTEPEVP